MERIWVQFNVPLISKDSVVVKNVKISAHLMDSVLMVNASVILDIVILIVLTHHVPNTMILHKDVLIIVLILMQILIILVNLLVLKDIIKTEMYVHNVILVVLNVLVLLKHNVLLVNS